MRKANWLAIAALAVAAAIGFVGLGIYRNTAPERATRSTKDLMAARRAEDIARANELRDLTTRFLARMAAKPKPLTIDLLVISGGGDWGAFGAGVLKGWGRVKGELARPEFDIVTGVSTGALIAPFAFLGDEQSI